MGVYLNSTSPFYLYKSETEKTYFIDKSLLLEQLFPLVKTGNSHICITRPQRFGKTIMANMLSVFPLKLLKRKSTPVISWQLELAMIKKRKNMSVKS